MHRHKDAKIAASHWTPYCSRKGSEVGLGVGMKPVVLVRPLLLNCGERQTEQEAGYGAPPDKIYAHWEWEMPDYDWTGGDLGTFVTHLECGLTGERYEADVIQGLSKAGRPLLV